MQPHLITAEARSWLGVPFLHQGRSRAGVDCAGLVICVCRALGALPPDFDVTGYTRQPDGSMQAACERYLQPAQAAPGGIFVMRYEGEPQHMGFYADYRHGGLSVVHAVHASGRVVEHRLDALWRRRVVASYAVPGTEPA